MSDSLNWIDRVVSWGALGYRASYDATAELIAGLPTALLRPFQGWARKQPPRDMRYTVRADGTRRVELDTDLKGWAGYMAYKAIHPMLSLGERWIVRPLANMAGFIGAGFGLAAGVVLATLKFSAPEYTQVTQGNRVFAKRINGALGKNIAENYYAGVLGAIAGIVVLGVAGIFMPQLSAGIIANALLGFSLGIRAKAILNLVRYLHDNAPAVLTWVRARLATLVNKLKDILTNIKQHILNIIGPVWDKIKTAVDNMIDILKNIKDSIQNMAKQVWANVKNIFNNVLNTIVAKFKNIGESIKAAAQFVWTGAKRVVNVVVDSVKHMDSVIKNSAQWVWAQVKTVANGFYSVYQTAKEKGISGLWEAFKDKTFGAVMRYMANANEVTRLESEINQSLTAYYVANPRLADTAMATIRQNGEVLRKDIRYGDITVKLDYYRAVHACLNQHSVNVLVLNRLIDAAYPAQKLAELANPAAAPHVIVPDDGSTTEELSVDDFIAPAPTFTPAAVHAATDASNDPAASVTMEMLMKKAQPGTK